MGRWLRWLLLLLVVANLLLLAAIFWKGPLQSMGWLSAPPERVDLPWQPLPPIAPPAATARQIDLPPESAGQQSDLGPDGELEATAANQPAPSPSTDSASDEIRPDPSTASADLPAEPSLEEGQLPTLACIVLGPFTNEDDAQAAMARVQQAGGRPLLQAEQIAAQPDYLVYVEPAVARDIALRTGQALKSQSIDAYVIPSGARRHGVSVGVFRDRVRALAQQKRVSELGYAVEIQTLDRAATMYRIVARDVPSAALAGRPLQGNRTATASTTPYLTCEEANVRPAS